MQGMWFSVTFYCSRISFMLLLMSGFVEGKVNVFNDCTRLLIGGSGTEDNEQSSINFSDIHKVSEMGSWRHVSCVAMELRSEGIVDMETVVNVANAIPKLKQSVSVRVQNSTQIVVGDQFRCLGYEIKLEVADSLEAELPVHLCDGSLVSVSVNVSFFGLFPHFIPDYQILGGTEHYIIEIVKDALEFEVETYRLARGYDKREDGDGNVIGVVGEVSTRVSEIGLGQPAMSASRFTLIDYSAQISTRDIGFCAQKPKRVDSFFKLVRPLEWQVWLGMGLTIFIVPMTFELLDRCMSVGPRTFANLSIAVQSILSESSLLHQPGRKTLISRQILLWAWLPVGTLLGMAFSSNLLTKLILVEQTKPFDTVDQMVKAGIQVQLLEGTLFKMLMKGSPRPEMRQLYKEGVEDQDGLLKSLAEVHSPERFKAQREKQAVVVCSVTFAIGNGYHFSRERISVLPASFVVAKGSSFGRPLNWVLSHLMASGLIERRYEYLLTKRALEIEKENPPEENTAGEEPLYLRHFQGIFILWGIGVAVAILSFALEKLI